MVTSFPKDLGKEINSGKKVSKGKSFLFDRITFLVAGFNENDSHEFYNCIIPARFRKNEIAVIKTKNTEKAGSLKTMCFPKLFWDLMEESVI